MAKAIGRIEREFLLKALESEGIELRQAGGRCRLESFRDDQLSLSLAEGSGPLERGVPLDFDFDYRDQCVRFRAICLESGGSRALVRLEGDWLSDLRRGFGRLKKPDDLNFSISLKGQRYLLDYPRLEGHAQGAQAEDQALAEGQSLEGLAHELGEWSAGMGARHSLHMFRGRSPEGLIQEMVAETGSIFYVPGQAMGLPPVDPSPYPDEKILTRDAVLEALRRRGHMEAHADHELKLLLRGLFAGGLSSLICVPLVFHAYVVGALELRAGQGAAAGLGLGLGLERVHEAFGYARALVYGLYTNGYFSKGRLESGQAGFQASVVDISASGMLLASQDPQLGAALTQDSSCDIFLGFQGRELSLKARLLRSYPSQGSRYYALSFYGTAPEDLRFLYEYLYGRPFDDRAAQSFL